MCIYKYKAPFERRWESCQGTASSHLSSCHLPSKERLWECEVVSCVEERCPAWPWVVSVEQWLDKFRLQITTYVKGDFFFFFFTKKIGYVCTSEVLIERLDCFRVFFGFIQFASFFLLVVVVVCFSNLALSLVFLLIKEGNIILI